jgi:Cof subfamily protein (haloacid dehalogenase superfamily)
MAGMSEPLRRPWLVTDLDGTLVDRDLRIAQRNLDAVARYRAAGGVVTIATGRNEKSAVRYHTQLGLETPMILYNGARIVDVANGNRLLDLRLDEAWPIVERDGLPELPPTVGVVGFHDLDAYLLKPARALAEYAARDQIKLRRSALPGCPTKLMVIGESPGDLAGVPETIAELLPGVRLVSSEKTYLEVLPAAADKGSALRLLAARSGVDLRDVAAIGDNPNDLELIRTAGLGAAVGDGHADLRHAADVEVAPCSQGAVADFINTYLLPETLS